MRHLLAPTLAVAFSIAGTAYGCHVSGMPAHEVKFATLLAGGVAAFAAYGAVLLAHLRRPTSVPGNSTRLR